MHTANQLDPSKFAVKVDGKPGSYATVFPGWNQHDRFGLIVDRPLGGVGASLLIQLAACAFYDADPTRSGKTYPELYVIHVGGFHGSFSWYDVFPPRKEVEVPDEASAILEAVNDRAITRLGVVDGPSEPVRHHLREPGAAEDRLASVLAYSPTGRVAEADVEIGALDPALEENTLIALLPERTEELQARLLGTLPGRPENERFVGPKPDLPPARVRETLLQGRRALRRDGLLVETYRRVTISDALGMLHCRSAP